MTFKYDKLWNKVKLKKINDKKLIKLLHIMPKTLAKLKNNQKVSISVLEKFANFFDCIIEDLVEKQKSSKNNMKYTTASLFAGIGGICYGFKQNNVDVIWANEIDANACATYRFNFGNDYLVEGDIKKINPNDIPNVDILNGGFPCQAFSIAGKQQGFLDERGTLFFEIVRILKIKKPQAILLENVKNLLTHDHNKTFKVIKNELENLGYHLHYQILNSMDYGNVPQNRERLYIIGFLNKTASDNFNFPSPIKLTKSISDLINANERQDKHYYYTFSKLYSKLKLQITKKNTIYQWRRIYCRENKSNVCPTLTANMGMGGHNVPLVLDNYDIRKLTPDECIAFQGFPKEFKFPDTIPDSAKYKQAGNSVSVPVIKRIVANMVKALDSINKKGCD